MKNIYQYEVLHICYCTRLHMLEFAPDIMDHLVNFYREQHSPVPGIGDPLQVRGQPALGYAHFTSSFVADLEYGAFARSPSGVVSVGRRGNPRAYKCWKEYPASVNPDGSKANCSSNRPWRTHRRRRSLATGCVSSQLECSQRQMESREGWQV